MPAGDQIDCYLSCNVRINKGELKQKRNHKDLVNLQGPSIYIVHMQLYVLSGHPPPFLHVVHNENV